MSLETPSAEQLQKAADTEKACAAAAAQKAEQAAIEQAKKAKELLDQANQKLAELPEKIIKGLNDTIDFLMSIIDGYVNPLDPKFKPETILAQIQAMLDPVVTAISALPVPPVPGLAQITMLLTQLKSLIATVTPGPGETSLPSAEIPPEIKATLINLLIALQSLCSTLPLVFINLIFQMLNTIIGMFAQIAGIIGVPPIPFPLNLAPMCVTLMPNMTKFMMNAPGQILNLTNAILRKAYGKIMTLQVPTPPADIKIPEGLPACKDHE